jgi:hypothetical protein
VCGGLQVVGFETVVSTAPWRVAQGWRCGSVALTAPEDTGGGNPGKYKEDKGPEGCKAGVAEEFRSF